MTVLKGDNLEILKTIESSSIDLIYMDPPFFTQKTQKLSNNKNIMYSFEDTWTSIEDYKEFLSVRLEVAVFSFIVIKLQIIILD